MMPNAQKVLEAVFSTASAVDQAKANDGKIDLQDAGLLIGPALKIPSAIAAAKGALEEFKNGTVTDRQELCAWAVVTFDIADDELEMKIESVLMALVHLSGLFAKPTATKVS